MTPKSQPQVALTIVHLFDGCESHIGRVGGPQELSLGSGCVWHGTILHEFLHALGFEHEHARIDRDNYIKVYRSNILAALKAYAQVEENAEADQQKMEAQDQAHSLAKADTGSVMNESFE
ncbi:conserved hypothetical protein [Ixodes scapularis]|uniref:Metalloendopeptidase n=1 Tax=Ixodes scapularis TaxID=6945 RepID=B7PWH0_IXOSC|nr:conserved hypothetical protein [Ixodes scapularis]|eukprot:XP_002409828.1 conserved hypothetical protein [Ixodes scapularis]